MQKDEELLVALRKVIRAIDIRSKELSRDVGVFLTDVGQSLLDKAPLPLQEHFLNRFNAIEEWEQSQMVATMQRIATMMDAQKIDAAPVLEVGSLVNNGTEI